MPRQIEDSEYDFLQSRAKVADFVESIYNHPKTGPKARALIKEAYPDLPIPEHDIREEVRIQLANDRKSRDDEKKNAKNQEDDKKFKAARKKTQDEYGFTDEGMNDLEKMMIERNIGDYEVAATYHAAKNPKTSDPTAAYQDQYWNHGRGDAWKEIATDPEAWGRKELMAAMKRDAERSRGG